MRNIHSSAYNFIYATFCSKLTVIIYLMCILSLTTCSIGSENHILINQTQPNLIIGNITTIPNKSAANNEYLTLPVYNKSVATLRLTQINIYATNHKINNAIIKKFVDTHTCSTIAPQSNCLLRIATNTKLPSYLLELSYVDNNENLTTTTQLINFSQNLSIKDGFTYAIDELANGIILPNNGNNSLSIPFRLTKNYAKIAVLVDNTAINFSCINNAYSTNTLCNAIVNLQNLFNENSQSQQPHKLKIIAYSHGGQVANSSCSDLNFTRQDNANIINSGINAVINPADGSSPVQIFLNNNGTIAASNLVIMGATPLIITPNTCSTTLGVNSTCSFYINVQNVTVSGQSTAAIVYNNGNNIQVTLFNVTYISPDPYPAISLTTSGSFTNKPINTGNTLYTVTITNTGSTTLTNLNFSDISLQSSDMASAVSGTTCIRGQSLAVGVSCAVVLSYNPTSIAAGSINFVTNMNYLNGGGQNLSYASSITISYSAISG